MVAAPAAASAVDLRGETPLSDVYAMGGRPLTALNIVAFPLAALGGDMLAQVLRGGQYVVAQAGATVVGGHSIETPPNARSCSARSRIARLDPGDFDDLREKFCRSAEDLLPIRGSIIADMPKSAPPPERASLLSRHLLANVQEALMDTRVVVVLGARQVGKSTLVQQIAAEEMDRRFITLDSEARRRAAVDDPTGFVAELQTPVVIDEVQRAPDLLLAIKQSVDEDQRPGRYLLTGSANLLTAATISDALTGRAEYLTLWPFSQAELHGACPHIIPALFAGTPPDVVGAQIGMRAHAQTLVAGGFAEALRRAPARRAAFFRSYLATVLDRDLRTIARVHDRANVRRLLDAIAAMSRSPLSASRLSRDLGIAANTVRAHIDLLETLFLVHRLPAWHSSMLSRLVRAPKLHVLDSGLLAYLLSADEERVCMEDRAAGALVETFVVMELVRHASVAADPPRMFHFRDRDGREVDLVLERRDGSVVGIEAKASATAGREDFRGLRLLRERLGERFAFGALFYTGPETVPFGERLAAVPLQGLWEGGR